MEDPAAAQSPDGAKREEAMPRKGWFFHPYTQIMLSIVLSAAAQLCLKVGADKSVPGMWMGIAGLRSVWVWMGIVALVTGLFSWLYGLRFVPLNIAFNVAGLTQVLVPLGSWLLLGERIGPTRAAGIALVCAGVYVVARPLMQVEEKL
jgi:drug/metabolite transporter (DMT)-like permease